MKKTVRIFALVAALTLCLVALTACSDKYGALKSAFEEEGFKENQVVEGVAEQIKQDLEKQELEVNIHVLTKGVDAVAIIEFTATEELAQAIKDSNTLQGFIKDVQESEDANEFYNKLVEAGYAKGNCLCIPLTVKASTMTEIVKSVK